MPEKPTRRLILVSNRLPFQLLEKNNKITIKQSDGGLVSALTSYFERDASRTFDSKLWVGSADFPEKRWTKYSQHPQELPFAIEPLFIDAKVYNKYYNGFCNATLWPLLHYFITYTVFDEESFQYYEQVNQQFADRLAALVKPGDTVWIHDYQLFLVPGLLRAKVHDVTIGFFLHIPFPSFEIFRLLNRHWKEKILRGMLGADLIGFHTHEYVQHFLKTVRMSLGYDHQYRAVAVEDRIVKADLFPLGIDFEKFHGAAQLPEVVAQKKQVLENFAAKKIIFSVDRLDYTKGITHRLMGFERFLEKYPEWKEKVVFVLVIVPSRQFISKYSDRKKLIEELVGRINGSYSTLQWQPIIYRYNHLSFQELCALYQSADVGLITPLRDGMNLVAKEYIASCVNKGVLVLSELTGAASELGESLLVNPMDVDEVGSAINEALTMPEGEQRHKLARMQKRLATYDVLNWVNDFINQLGEVKIHQKENSIKKLTVQYVQKLTEEFTNATKRLLFLDYDGTLVPFAKNPKEARPGAQVLDLVQKLTANPKNRIVIISGRDSTTLNEWFGALPVTLVAEHGVSVRTVNGAWQHLRMLDEAWKQNIRPTLELFVMRCPGSFIEEKNHTLAWHYRAVGIELGFTRSRELLDSLMHLVRNAQLQVIDGNKVIEVRVAGVDKGTAARLVMEREQPDFTLVMGDDKTDEDMFKNLQLVAHTIKIGAGVTHAQHMLPSQQHVISFLKQLTSV